MDVFPEFSYKKITKQFLLLKRALNLTCIEHNTIQAPQSWLETATLFHARLLKAVIVDLLKLKSIKLPLKFELHTSFHFIYIFGIFLVKSSFLPFHFTFLVQSLFSVIFIQTQLQKHYIYSQKLSSKSPYR